MGQDAAGAGAARVRCDENAGKISRGVPAAHRQEPLKLLLNVENLVEDFLVYLRHERGQAENTQKTYAPILHTFIAWAKRNGIADWKSVELRHLMSFLEHERSRPLLTEPTESQRRLSSERVYLEIAALRAFYRFAENEKHLPAN